MGQWLERYRAALLFAVVLVAVAAVVLLQLLRTPSQPVLLSTATPSPPAATPTPRPIRVYVSGAVPAPDVYSLPPDSIVKDALLAAGGPADDADLDRINLASPVADGQQIHVPRLGETELPVQPPGRQPSLSLKVNINTADASALETLPGIGPTLARRIVDHRQANGLFAAIEDITQVSGIGSGTFEQIRDLITTE